MSWWIIAVTLVTAVGLVVGGRRLVTSIRDALQPFPDDGLRHCPHCGHTFEGTRRYCLACGGQIWDDVLSQTHHAGTR